jgi:hypothetical protein
MPSLAIAAQSLRSPSPCDRPVPAIAQSLRSPKPRDCPGRSAVFILANECRRHCYGPDKPRHDVKNVPIPKMRISGWRYRANGHVRRDEPPDRRPAEPARTANSLKPIYVTDRNVSLYVPALSTRKRRGRRDLQGRIDALVTMPRTADHSPNQPRPNRGVLHHCRQQARQSRAFGP